MQACAVGGFSAIQHASYLSFKSGAHILWSRISRSRSARVADFSEHRHCPVRLPRRSKSVVRSTFEDSLPQRIDRVGHAIVGQV